MSERLKYVMMQVDGKKVPFIFPGLVTHKWFANDIQHAILRSADDLGKRPTVEIVSAGFVALNPDMSVTVYGRSESLSLDSKKEDEEEIEEMLST